MRVKPKRNRDREDAGISPLSYLKHRLFEQVILAQVSAFRARNPQVPFLLIDGNGGDGTGVDEQQIDMFQANLSKSTAELLCRIGSGDLNADVVLCEKDAAKRAVLSEAYPDASVTDDHAKALDFLRDDHGYALWLSDPCGPAGHGIEHMQALSNRCRFSDFAIAFNEGAVSRIVSTKSDLWATSRRLYGDMMEPKWWLSALNRKQMSRTGIQNISQNFKARVMVVSNYLAQGSKRPPFEVVQ